MSRRPLLLLPAVLAAIALPVAPALAGEDDDDSPSATLHASQGCVSGDRANASVTGDDIDTVAYFLDGNHVKTVTQPNAQGRFSISMACAHLRVGAHRARAVVTFEAGSSPARQTLRFQITRSRQGSPRFAG
jgi:hypothetical protein